MREMMRLMKSFGYAARGIAELLRTQPNALIHVLSGMIAIALGFIFRINTYEWIAIIIVIGLVFAAETFNTAIEILGDRVSRDHDPDVEKIKDIAAGAVLIMAITALITGLIIFVPKIF